MKPYRGTLLAAAMLLATLPLSGCGDADKFAESGEIKLTSDVQSVAVNHDVNFTVVSNPTPPKVIIPECDMALEYESKGADISQSWTAIPGTGATRMFTLKPRETSPLSVLARGKCIDSKEEWKYSNPLVVTVTDPSIPTITLVANPTSVAQNKPVTFTLGATAEGVCDIQLSYEYSGAGYVGVTKVNPAYFGQFILIPTKPGNLNVTASSWCSQRPAGVNQITVSVPVTAVALPKVQSITLTAAPNPYGTSGTLVIFSFTAVKDAGCTARFNYTRSGGGLAATTVDLTPGVQTFSANPITGTLTATVNGRCDENPTDVISSNTVNVSQ